MSIDDEELLHQFMRTSMLVNREQHSHDEELEGPPPPPPGGHDDQHGPGGPGDRPGPEGRPPRGGPPPQPGPPPQTQRPSEERVLAMLVAKEGLSQKDLAYLLGIRPQSLTNTLTQLEDAGFIERRRNPDDRRSFKVYLTENGREHAEQRAESRARRAQDTFAALDEQDKEELSRILEKLSDALEG